VVKLTTRAGQTFDFSIPRRDSKVGPGHKGFETVFLNFDPSNPAEGSGGAAGLHHHALMFESAEKMKSWTSSVARRTCGSACCGTRVVAFSEDPLRVLRGISSQRGSDSLPRERSP